MKQAHNFNRQNANGVPEMSISLNSDSPIEAYRRNLLLAASVLRDANANPNSAVYFIRRAIAATNAMERAPYRSHARSKAMRALNFARRVRRSLHANLNMESGL
jgi:hypothetical protein